MRTRTPAASLLAVLLAACSLAPRQAPVKVDIPAAWRELPAAERGSWKPARPSETVARGRWWTVFGDPVLDRLEDTAQQGNQTLQVMAARVSQARALTGVVSAQALPQVDAGAGVSRVRYSPVATSFSDAGPSATTSIWRGLVAASYEPDLFSRVSDSVRAARSDQQALEASARSVQLALQADVAQAYFGIRGAEAALAESAALTASRTRTLRLQERRLALGDVSRDTVAVAAAAVARARSDQAALERTRAQLEDALALLLGRPPARLQMEAGALPGSLPQVPPGLPSALLERRPDVAAAQTAMAGANARIGVARAAFFPAIHLTALAGQESADLRNLFDWSSRTWALGPITGTLATLPLFDGGRNRANLERARAAYEEAVASYRGQVLVAFSEVESALAALRTLQEQQAAAEDALEAAAEISRLAQARLKAGSVGQLEALEGERGLQAARLGEIQVRAARAGATVSLIRALGGGWEAP